MENNEDENTKDIFKSFDEQNSYNDNSDDDVLDSVSFGNSENASSNSSDETSKNENSESEKPSFSADTSEKKQDTSFVSFEEASKMNGGNQKKKKKPPKLNKSQILGIVVGVAFLMVGIIIFTPAADLVKNQNKDKPTPSTPMFSNYEGLAENDPNAPPAKSLQEQLEEKKREEEAKKAEEQKKIEENGGINPKYTAKSDEPKLIVKNGASGRTSTVGGSGTTLDIPDTRNDALQGKRISGIKGLTNSQANYATNYDAKKEENSRIAASLKTNSSGRTSTTSNSNGYGNAVSKSEYASMLQNSNSYAQQNDQAGKKSFYENGRDETVSGQYLGLNSIWQGTIFEVVLTSDINTDLPGEITGRVAKNVYSSQDSRYLLIPQNSVVIGTYNSSISYAQSRIQVQWNTLIRPDGYSINLGGMNGTDDKGASGIKGFINDHPLAYVKAIALMSVFSIANTQFQNSIDSASSTYAQNVAANTQEVVNELGDKLIDRAMNVQPTIKVKAGTKLNIVANQTIYLPPVEDLPVTQRYKRGALPKEID